MAFEHGLLNSKSIDEALKRLNGKMVYAEVDAIEFVVCGGAALIVTGMIARSTGDVDIVALARITDSDLELMNSRSLPPDVERLASEVAVDMGIDKSWLNFGPGPLLDFGLPEGLATRLTRRSYGACLTVHFIGRLDQIQFKLYAAMDPKEGTRHLSDLLDLEPAEDELRIAIAWLLNREVGAPFKTRLKQVLERLGYEEFARNI